MESSEDAELGRFLNNFVNVFHLNIEPSRGSADALCAAFTHRLFSGPSITAVPSRVSSAPYRFAVGAICDGSLSEADAF